LSLFAKGFHIVYAGTTPKLHVVDKDPDYNKFIECAVALHSTCIITGDSHLSAIKNYMGIKILSPKEFLAGYTKT